MSDDDNVTHIKLDQIQYNLFILGVHALVQETNTGPQCVLQVLISMHLLSERFNILLLSIEECRVISISHCHKI